MSLRPTLLLLLAFTGCSEFVDRVPDAHTSCISTCQTVGAVACVEGDSAGARQVCVDQGELTNEGTTCAAWEPAESCGEALACRGAGVCGADACPGEAATTCQGAAGVQRCVKQANGFFAWEAPTACPAGSVCADGACAESSSCPEVGRKRCTAKGIEACQVVGGQTVWTAGAPCADGEQCRGAGLCGVDACDLGAVTCAGDALSPCEVGPNGFRVWADPIACPDGGVCRDGVCGKDLCTELGATGCTADGARRVCKTSADGFLTWAAGESCPDGQTCRVDGCGADECTPAGAIECVGTSARTCELHGAFLGWSQSAPCADGACVSGASGDACVPHECAGKGASKCLDPTSVSLCELGTDGVFRWGPSIPCPGVQAVCRAQGVCGVDECPAPGVRECTTDAAFRECLDPGDELFYSWGDAVSCGPGETCRSGTCGVDACQTGDFSCTEAGLSGCALQLSGFFQMTGYLPCPAAEMDCGTGKCRFETSFGPVAAALAPAGVSAIDVTALPSGGFALAWTNLATGAIELARYDALGLPTESPEVVSEGAVGAVPVLAGSVPGAGAGDVVVLWHDVDEGVIRARWMIEGAASPPAFALPPKGPLAAAPFPTLVRTSSGVTALRVETPSPDRIWSSPLNPDGVQYNLETGSSDGPVRGLAAARSPTGGFMVAWSRGAVDGLVGGVDTRAVDLAGGVITSVRTIAWPGEPGALAATTVTTGLAVVGEIDDGTLGVAFVPNAIDEAPSAPLVLGPGSAPSLDGAEAPTLVFERAESSGRRIYAFRADASGNPIGSPLPVSDELPPGDAFAPRIATLTGGDSIVVYRVGTTPRARFLRP